MAKIKLIKAKEILSSSGLPTLQVDVILNNGKASQASVPYGASAGKKEAVTLFDNDKNRFFGKGELLAAKNVNQMIAPKLKGKNPLKQQEIDKLLIALDGTANKSKIGGNAILGTSLAVARAGAMAKKIPLYKYLSWLFGNQNKKFKLPKPMIVLIEGGRHAFNSTDFQEYLIVPMFNSAAKNIQAGVEVYYNLKKILEKEKLQTTVGSEGAFAPDNLNNSAPWNFILSAIKSASYRAGKEIMLAADLAASEIYKKGVYYLSKEGKKLKNSELVEYLRSWIDQYPILSIEDPMSEVDWPGWILFFSAFKKKIKIIADDLTVTNKNFLQKSIDLKAANGIIIKPNQTGTLTETVETILLAQKNKYQTIVSHRGGGETNDDFIVDLAVAFNCNFLKVGITRGERVVKYNRLLEIEEEL